MQSVLETAFNALVIYLFAFATGFGLYELVVPNYLKKNTLLPFLPVGLGLLQLSILGAYCIAASMPIVVTAYLDGGLSFVTLLIALVRGRDRLPNLFTSVPRFVDLFTYRRVIFALLIVFLLVPTLRTGMSTTPYRIGIDQVGYGETAQFLIEGGTLKTAQATLLTELSTHDVKKSLLNNLLDLSFNTYVDTEFLLKALRWGFPASLAVLTMVTSNSHVYHIEFLVLIFSYALSMALVYHILRVFFDLSENVSFAIMAAFALNCNELNVYYEGQFAQIFIMPYFILLITLYGHARRWVLTGREPRYRSAEYVKTCALFGVLLAGMFADYNEAILLIFGFLYMTMLLDAVFRAATLRKAAFMTVIGTAIGFVLMAPLSIRYVAYTLANLANLGNAGFFQPHWGSLAEIVGFMDMYRVTGYKLLDRSMLDATFSIVLSLAAAATAVFFLVRDKRVDRAFWATPLLLLLAAYLKIRYIGPSRDAIGEIINYSYFKIYTMLLPWVVLIVVVGVYSLVRNRGVFGKLGFAAVLGTIVVTGVLYIDRYAVAEQWVTPDMYAMYTPGGQRLLSDYVFMTPTAGLPEFMLSPILQMNWIGESNTPKIVADSLSKPVIVLLKNADLRCKSCFIAHFSDQIVFENASYTAYNTKMTLAQICPGDQTRFNVSMPPAVAAMIHSQCNYAFPHTLPWVI